MKNAVIRCLGAVMFVMPVSSCGGDSAGTKVAKDFCECISKESVTGRKISELESAMVSLVCFGGIAEKYKEYFDSGEANLKFKNPQHQKDFEATIKKCAPDWVRPGK